MTKKKTTVVSQQHYGSPSIVSRWPVKLVYRLQVVVPVVVVFVDPLVLCVLQKEEKHGTTAGDLLSLILKGVEDHREGAPSADCSIVGGEKIVGNAEEPVDDALEADTTNMLCVRYAVVGFSYAVGSSYRLIESPKSVAINNSP